MRITSPYIVQDNDHIPTRFTCDGEDINPPLVFEDVPEATVSLALTMEDPDATRGTFDHWLIWNMPPRLKGIGEHSTPPGIQGVNSKGDKGYTGPCPPSGDHRYIFTLYALDTNVHLDRHAGKTEFLPLIDGHVIAKAQLIGRYSHREV